MAYRNRRKSFQFISKLVLERILTFSEVFYRFQIILKSRYLFGIVEVFLIELVVHLFNNYKGFLEVLGLVG